MPPGERAPPPLREEESLLFEFELLLPGPLLFEFELFLARSDALLGLADPEPLLLAEVEFEFGLLHE